MAWTTPKTWVASELVTASELNEQLRDNLNSLLAPPEFFFATASGTFTTSSTTPVSISGDYEQTITTRGGPVILFAKGATLYLDIDDTDVPLWRCRSSVANTTDGFFCAPYKHTPAAGSHTYKLQWEVSNGAETATITCVEARLTFWGVEI